MTEVNEGKSTREDMSFCIIFLSYNKAVNHSKQIQGSRLKNDPSLGPWLTLMYKVYWASCDFNLLVLFAPTASLYVVVYILVSNFSL